MSEERVDEAVQRPSDDLRGCMRDGSAADFALWRSVCDQMDAEQAAWVARLRADGVKMAHPDDGHVDRAQHYVAPCYPQFDDGAQIGDLICLGSPGHNGQKSRERIVRVLRIDKTMFGHARYWFDSEAVR